MTAQAEFDAIYITSSELRRRLNVSRSAITRMLGRGDLPDPIALQDGQLHIWRRQDVQTFLKADAST